MKHIAYSCKSCKNPQILLLVRIATEGLALLVWLCSLNNIHILLSCKTLCGFSTETDVLSNFSFDICTWIWKKSIMHLKRNILSFPKYILSNYSSWKARSILAIFVPHPYYICNPLRNNVSSAFKIICY